MNTLLRVILGTVIVVVGLFACFYLGVAVR